MPKALTGRTSSCRPHWKVRAGWSPEAGTLSRPAHGAGARRLDGAACLCLRPGWPRHGGVLRACGRRAGVTLCGWGGRLHGFRQPLWGEPLRSWPQRRALTGRSADCPTRRSLRGHDHSPQSSSSPKPLRKLFGGPEEWGVALKSLAPGGSGGVATAA